MMRTLTELRKGMHVNALRLNTWFTEEVGILLRILLLVKISMEEFCTYGVLRVCPRSFLEEQAVDWDQRARCWLPQQDLLVVYLQPFQGKQNRIYKGVKAMIMKEFAQVY